MTPNTTRNWLAALIALSFTACTADVLEPGAEVGVLEMPLVSSAANGTQFMLEATFDLVGPETMQAVADPTQPDWSDDVLTLTPRVGSYALTISNWRVFELLVDPATGNINGSSWISAASLLSNAVQSVEILNNQTTSVVYQFSVPGAGVINFARGTLNIDFAVQQGLPDGSACSGALDCASLVCAAVAGGPTCAAPSCDDGVQNGSETSPDCGGGCTCAGPTACNAAQAAVCAPGDTCTVDATGNASCSGGSATACTAAEAATCAAGDTCTVDAAGIASCSGGSATACTAAEAASCAAGDTCVVDAAGNPSCSGGSATACTAAEAASCAAGDTCVVDAAGIASCVAG